MSKKGKTVCSVYAQVGDEDSKLHKELTQTSSLTRPLANAVYAMYMREGIAENMDNQGYKRNKQGQHNASDVIQYLGINEWLNNAASISTVKTNYGIIDSTGALHNFDTATEALDIADRINEEQPGLAAIATRNGDKFNVQVSPKDARTLHRSTTVKRQQQTWIAIDKAFIDGTLKAYQDWGGDIAFMNATNGKNIVYWMKNLGTTRNDLFSERELERVLFLSDNLSLDNNDARRDQKNRLCQKLGLNDYDYQGLAESIYNYYKGNLSVSADTAALIDSTMHSSKEALNPDNLNIDNYTNTVSEEVERINKDDFITPEAEAVKILDELYKEYGIDMNIINDKQITINSLIDVVSAAMHTLQRQQKILVEQQGKKAGINMQAEINRLTLQIANKKYVGSVLRFLSEAASQVETIHKLMEQAIGKAESIEENFASRSEAFQKIDEILSGYQMVVEAVEKLESLEIEEDLSEAEKQQLKDLAGGVAKELRKYRDSKGETGVLHEAKMGLMNEVLQQIIGPTLADGNATSSILGMLDRDSGYLDRWLYSMSRQSNPAIASMGEIIRNTQSEATVRLRDISIRIRRADYKLRKKHSNTRFMYDPDNYHIISDIDWVKYEQDKYNARERYKQQGKKGLELYCAMEEWVETHTEDRVVNQIDSRTERVPNQNYRQEMPNLTPEQWEYYDTMMQLKGELGSLLPEYAQQQYVAPQLRRDLFQALYDEGHKKGWSKKFNGWRKAIGAKIADSFIVREDDVMNTRNGIIIDGEEYAAQTASLDNTPRQRIPIFFINRLKDSNQLSKDFSGGIQALAATAINFDSMNRVRDLLEFMGEYIKSQPLKARTPNEKNAIVERLENTGITFIKHMVAKATATNNIAIIDGFLEKFLYGKNMAKVTKWNKLWRTLLAQHSKRSLSVNLKGATQNLIMGEFQMFIEAGCGEFYNFKDYAYAKAKLLSHDIIGAPLRIKGALTNGINNEGVLLTQIFDPKRETFGNLAHQHYHRNPIRNLANNKDTLMFGGYGLGEYWIHMTTMYAILHRTKVMDKYGKRISLDQAFEKTETIDGNAELKLKEGVAYQDEYGDWVDVDEAFLDKVRDKISYCNQMCHGAMNDADKGLIHRYTLGRLIMNLRQWMVEFYSRRYRKRYYDASIKQYREGFYNTFGKLALSWVESVRKKEIKAALKWSEMDEGQKRNVWRFLMEQTFIAALTILNFIFGDEDDTKGDWWARFGQYQLKRLTVDFWAGNIGGIMPTIKTTVHSPIPAYTTINAYLYPIYGIGDYWKDPIKRGRYKGWNRYWKNLYVYTVPYVRQINQLQDLAEDAHVYQLFNTTPY